MKKKRVLFKLSGELLIGNGPVDEERVLALCKVLTELTEIAEIAVVTGAGNIVRGKNWTEKVLADEVGMLATFVNARALYNGIYIASGGKVPCRIYAPFEVGGVARRFDPVEGRDFIRDGIIIFAGGTGNPLFTTDTVAVIRAVQLEVDFLAKGTKVDGLYTADPEKEKDAEFIPEATYDEVIQKRLAVLDLVAFELARENNLQIRIFNATRFDNLKLLLEDKVKYSIVH